MRGAISSDDDDDDDAEGIDRPAGVPTRADMLQVHWVLTRREERFNMA